MKKMLLTGVALGLGLAFSSAANAQIKIGVGGPITGPNASFGAQLKNGAEQAVEDINAAGGVNGQKLQIVIGDDVSDPKQGVSAANKFAGEGVKWVVGHFNSGVSIPASEVYQESGIIQITPASTNPRFTDRPNMWNVFRTCGRDDQQGAVAGAYLSNKFKGKKVAIVHDKTPYGKGLADETQKTMNGKGLKEVLYEGINTGEKDYSALVSKLKDAQVDVLYVGGYHTEAGLIVRQMRDQGMKTILVSGDALVTDEYWQITGDAGEGTLMTFSPDPRKNPEAADVVKEFKDKGIDPEGYVLYTYAAVQAWAQAATAAGSTDYDKVVDALYTKGPFKTVLGDLTFDDKGDVKLPGYRVYVWHAGKYDYLEQ
jgi:branched-chain amino acid transport system substrate-binding protein